MNVAVHGTNPSNGAAMLQIFTPRAGEHVPWRRACSWIKLMSELNPLLEFRLYHVETDESRLALGEISNRYG